MKQRLDRRVTTQRLVPTRSQAESFIKLGQVTVNKQVVTKPGFLVGEQDTVEFTAKEQYVSRAGLKLASVAQLLKLNFQDKVVLDVGSSTGGFTEYALRHGARKVIAVDVGTDQMHPSLRMDSRIELHEKTDIRDFETNQQIDMVVADVSFISLTEILPSIARLSNLQTAISVMVKPQFEASADTRHKGVIKNDKLRREILKNFESWTMNHGFIIVDKADSEVSGAKGNTERFYLLRLAKRA